MDVLEGQPAARRAFVERMRVVGRLLTARNRRMGQPFQDSELADLTQETLLQVWRKLSTYRGEASLETWVYRFSSLEFASALRRRGRQPQRIEDVEAAEPVQVERGDEVPEGIDPPFDQQLGQLLRHLSRREAEVVRLVHVDTLGLREVAERLGISVSSVKTHYYRGLDKLRQVLESRSSKERSSGEGGGQ